MKSLSNHLAILYSAKKQAVTLPMGTSENLNDPGTLLRNFSY